MAFKAQAVAKSLKNIKIFKKQKEFFKKMRKNLKKAKNPLLKKILYNGKKIRAFDDERILYEFSH